MQMSFQLLSAAARPSRACAAAGLLTLGFVAELRAAESRADLAPAASAWSEGTKSAARLIAAPAPAAGPYRAGVEIRLAPGALTYWRTPGEAGTPPVFDFAASENVKSAIVSYPAPARIEEAGFDLFGYSGGVVFPVEVELADDSRPAVLALTLDYAVCGDICLPARAKAALALPPRSAAAAPAPATPEAQAIEAARAKAPLRLDAAARDAKIAVVQVEGAERPTWRLRALPEPEILAAATRGADGEAADLFVEAPQGWYFESKRTARTNEFLLVEVEAPKPQDAAADAASSPVTVTATLTQPRQSYEFTLDLDAGPQRP